MTEEFIHYLWKYRLFKPELKLANGEVCKIIDPGTDNQDAGPDFFNARIMIGTTVWAGNVEIHSKSSDWFTHNHHCDKAYENIILHVVMQNDKPVIGKNGQAVPTLVFDESDYSKMSGRYKDFMSNRNWIPCASLLSHVDRFIINSWLDRMAIERLEEKAMEIESQLFFNHNNWEQTFYEFLARNFGFKVNSLPFDLLAKSLPLNVLGKHKNSVFQLESLLYGQAGFLDKSYRDSYPRELSKEYSFLRDKYNLVPLDLHLWKFMRLRPSNFPTIRLAQFASLVFHSNHLFSKLLEIRQVNKLTGLFDVQVSDYWMNHFNFDKSSSARTKNLGKSAIQLIIINTVIPFLFVYGRNRSEPELMERSVRFLEQLPGENNGIIKKWEAMGLSTRTALNTQALIQLKTGYCNLKKCLYCSIGNKLLIVENK